MDLFSMPAAILVPGLHQYTLAPEAEQVFAAGGGGDTCRAAVWAFAHLHDFESNTVPLRSGLTKK